MKFPELRPRYEQTQREFPAAFEAGIQHFRKAFPGFTPNIPVYLLHSLGEMDGGIRELGGKNYLIFDLPADSEGGRVQVIMRRWLSGIARHQRCPSRPA